MKIKMSEQVINEVFGKVLFLGADVRYMYDQNKKEYTNEIQGVTVNLGAENKENSFSVQVEILEVPDIKKWGTVKFEGLEYDPYATVSTFEQNGVPRSRGVLNDRLRCKQVLPASLGDKKPEMKTEQKTA